MKLQNYILFYNVLLLFAIVFLNTFLLYGLKKTGQMFKRSNLIIFSMCISDLSIGLLVEPLHLYRIYKDSCLLGKINYGLAVLFTNNSVFSVYLLAALRYYSIKGGLTGKKVPRKLILFTIGLSWSLAALAAILHVFFLSKLAYFCFITAAYIIGTILFVYFYASVLYITHKSQRAIESCSNSKTIGRDRKMKTTRTVIALFATMVICYTPMIVIGDYRAVMNQKKTSYDHQVIMMTVFYWSLSLLYTNSAMNALLFLSRNGDVGKLFKQSFFF